MEGNVILNSAEAIAEFVKKQGEQGSGENPENKEGKREGEKQDAGGSQITEEQKQELIKQWAKENYGTDDLSKIKLAEETEVLTEEEKVKREKEQEAEIVSVGLKEGWFTKQQYDTYQQLKGADKIAYLKDKWLKENPDETEDDFNAVFHLDDYEVDQEDESKKTPSKAQVIARKMLEKEFEQTISNDYSGVINAKDKYLSEKVKEKLSAANKKVLSTVATEIPKEEITDLGFSFEYTAEQVSEAVAYFEKNEKFLQTEGVKPEDIKIGIIDFLRAKNFSAIVKEAAENYNKAKKEEYERGIKGIPIEKSNAEAGSESAAMQFLKEKKLV